MCWMHCFEFPWIYLHASFLQSSPFPSSTSDFVVGMSNILFFSVLNSFLKPVFKILITTPLQLELLIIQVKGVDSSVILSYTIQEMLSCVKMFSCSFLELDFSTRERNPCHAWGCKSSHLSSYNFPLFDQSRRRISRLRFPVSVIALFCAKSSYVLHSTHLVWSGSSTNSLNLVFVCTASGFLLDLLVSDQSILMFQKRSTHLNLFTSLSGFEHQRSFAVLVIWPGVGWPVFGSVVHVKGVLAKTSWAAQRIQKKGKLGSLNIFLPMKAWNV